MPSEAYAMILALVRKENDREFSGRGARGWTSRAKRAKGRKRMALENEKEVEEASRLGGDGDGERRTRKSDGRIGRKQGERSFCT